MSLSDFFDIPVSQQKTRRKYSIEKRGIHIVNVRILVGHVLDKLRELPDESVHCCITSPPYYGLRDYGIEPQIWGGAPNCEHQWDEKIVPLKHCDDGITGSTLQGGKSTQIQTQRQPTTHALCRRCGCWRGSLGLEPTLDLYLDHMVEVCREIRRVLRKDGTFWLNIGSSYATQPGKGSNVPQIKWQKVIYPENAPHRMSAVSGGKHPSVRKTVGISDITAQSAPLSDRIQGKAFSDTACRCGSCGKCFIRLSMSSLKFKAKDLMDVPSLLQFALQADGWYVRSRIEWVKDGPMPESVTDRPTSAHEEIFLLTKSAKYFYDAEAVKQPYVQEWNETNSGSWSYGKGDAQRVAERGKAGTHSGSYPLPQTVANLRNVWRLPPSPFPDAHFATFPTELPRRCILAGTSERGVCPKCGAPWTRIIAKGDPNKETTRGQQAWAAVTGQRDSSGGFPYRKIETVGWQSTCSCKEFACANCGKLHTGRLELSCPDCSSHFIAQEPIPVPATVLEPFLGSGTTSMVAAQLGRHSIGIELNSKYAEMARDRIDADTAILGYSKITVE